MIDMFNNQKRRFLIWGLCITAILAAGLLAAAGQGINTSGPDSAYCTSNGYIYTTIPGANSGKAVCQFPDGSWCDGHSYFTGNCTPNASVVNAYNPYAFNSPQGALEIADASKMCQNYGGGVQIVHTSYGDVRMCVFPGGSMIDLRGLYGSALGGYYPGYYPGPYFGGYWGDNWYYGAYAWLNAP